MMHVVIHYTRRCTAIMTVWSQGMHTRYQVCDAGPLQLLPQLTFSALRPPTLMSILSLLLAGCLLAETGSGSDVSSRMRLEALLACEEKRLDAAHSTCSRSFARLSGSLSASGLLPMASRNFSSAAYQLQQHQEDCTAVFSGTEGNQDVQAISAALGRVHWHVAQLHMQGQMYEHCTEIEWELCSLPDMSCRSCIRWASGTSRSCST
jgi:hypothetical protein